MLWLSENDVKAELKALRLLLGCRLILGTKPRFSESVMALWGYKESGGWYVTYPPQQWHHEDDKAEEDGNDHDNDDFGEDNDCEWRWRR